MKNRHRWIWFLILFSASIPANASEDTSAEPYQNVQRLAVDSKKCITAEKHFWIRGGQITVNPSLQDPFGVQKFYSPPFASTCKLTVTFNGKPVELTSYEWRPDIVIRHGQSGNLRLRTCLIPTAARRAFLLTARVVNQGTKEITIPITVAMQGNLDQVQVWSFSPPKAKEPLRSGDPIDGQLLLKNQHGCVALRTSLTGNRKLDRNRAIITDELKLAPNKGKCFYIAIAVGTEKEATAAAEAILAKPMQTISKARRFWSRQIEQLYKRFPRITSDNQKLVDFYDRGLLSIPLARWEMPGFVLSPHYATSGIDGGAFCCYLWDFAGYGARINPIADPAATRAHLMQLLKSKPMEYYAFSPLDGTPIGAHYSYNQYSMVRGIYHYVTLTGDVAFLNEKVDGKTILEHVIVHATYGDEKSKPVRLIDYGSNRNLLELKRTKAYEGYVPSPNAERCWSYRAADQLADLAGKPSPNLSPRADELAKHLNKKLWSDSLGWFQTRDKKGNLHTCYSIQIFDLLRFDILDPAKQEAILKHLNEEEFLSGYGVHSLSKKDPGYDPNDVDWGGPGVYTADAPQLICDLYHSGHPQQAGDLLRRILWWGQTMPYYPQAIHADRIDYRQNGRANLQNGAATAEALLFGVLGLDVTPQGTVSIRPYLPPETTSLEFKNVRVRNLTFDAMITTGGFKIVTAGGRTVSGTLGQKVVVEEKEDLGCVPTHPTVARHRSQWLLRGLR